MTENERAIQALKKLRDDCYEDDGYGNITDECAEELWAIDTAIEALKERKKGKWIDGHCMCSVCKWYPTNRYGFAVRADYNYCPNCGVEMEVEE